MNILYKMKDIVLEFLKKILGKFKRVLHFLLLSGAAKIRHVILSGIIVMASLIIIVVLGSISSGIKSSVPAQTAHLSWGGDEYALVSCFFSQKDGMDLLDIREFEYHMQTDLNSYLAEKKVSKDETETKLWTDAYAGKGTLTVSANGASVTGTAYGVGGDFFTIHDFPLLDGGYLDKDNVMKDYIILDEDSSWQLFGSSNVSGLSVNINGDIYIVAGVIDRAEGYFNDAAGNNKSTFYIPYESLQKYDENVSITAYEVIMRNPVKHYAYDYVNKKLGNMDTENLESSDNSDVVKSVGSDDDTDEKKAVEVIENSDRFSFINILSHIKNTFINTMLTKDILYPFWENVARGYMNVLSLLLFIQLILATIILVTIIILSIVLRKKCKFIQKQLDNTAQNE